MERKKLGLDEDEIKRRLGYVKFTDHARVAMREEGISVDEVVEALSDCEVIERYPNDKPFPSCLVYGQVLKKHIHVVCALPKHINALIVITVYIPSTEKWIDFRRRRK